MAQQTCKVTRSVTAGGTTVGGTAQSFNVDVALPITKDVPVGSTNFEIDVPTLVISTLTLVAIESSQNCTVLVNTVSSPPQTLALVANVPLIWVVNDVAANWLTVTSLTKLFVTVPLTATGLATIKFTAAADITPGG